MMTEIQDSSMRRFLLGDLPDPEASLLEAELLANDERFEQMWEMENGLVDDYVRGKLPRVDQERFERHYLASPVHVQRVAVARKLIEAADAQGIRNTSEAKTASSSFFERLRFWPASLQYALAAAVLLFAVTTIWLIIQQSRLRNQLAQIQAERNVQQDQERNLAAEVAAAQQQKDRLASELEQLRAEKPIKEQQPTPPAEQTQTPKVFSFLLSPTLVRGSGDSQLLTIPLKTDVVRLQMRTGRETARVFQVSVRTVEGSQIWQKQVPLNKGAVIAQIPASKLPSGDFILTLSAIEPAGKLEETNRYFFRVIRQ